MPKGSKPVRCLCVGCTACKVSLFLYSFCTSLLRAFILQAPITGLGSFMFVRNARYNPVKPSPDIPMW
jgi:hypothetical protein